MKQMGRRIFIISGLLWLAPLLVFGDEPKAVSGNPNEAEILTLAVGVTQELSFDFEPKFEVGNQQILQVTPSPSNPRNLIISPQRKGQTSLRIRNEKNELVRNIIYNLITTELTSKVIAIRQLLQDVEGITIKQVDDKIVIDGELVVPRDFDRILQVQQAYQNDGVLNLVTLSRISREALARRMQRAINDDPEGANVAVSIVNDTFFLTGKVDSATAREKSETIALTYMPDFMGSQAIKDGVLQQGARQRFALRNLIFIEDPPPPPPPKMVRVTYHFVEIGKNYLKSSFFKWQPTLSENAGLQFGQSTGGSGAAAASGSFAGTLSSLLPRLNSATQGGFARILYSAVTLGEEGIKQQLNRTDQIPYFSASGAGNSLVAFAPVTISLDTTPQSLDEKRVRMAIVLTFSSARGAGNGSPPESTSTSNQTTLIVNSGESAAIGGFVSNDSAKDVDKDPEGAAEGQGRPLFTLLRSKGFRNKKTQFVVFVTPKIIQDASEGTADIKQKILNNSSKKRRRVVQ
jgi:pilus assembly protein CpaC